jgi:hypothetical protein
LIAIPGGQIPESIINPKSSFINKSSIFNQRIIHSLSGGAKTAWFKDSEGNILAVSQRA